MDIDKSLDEIIKQRNIGVIRPNRTRPPVKSPGATAAAVRRTVVTQDARSKLQLLQRARIKDARERLNQKRMHLDAREKLNRIGAQKVATVAVLHKQKIQPRQVISNKNSSSASRLTRTVENNVLNRPGLRGTNNALAAVKNNRKKVVMTKAGLTIISSQPRAAKFQTVAPSAVFARTVDSLAKDVMTKSGLVKTTKNIVPLPKKRQAMPDDDVYDDDLEYASIESEAELKRLKLSDGSIGQSKLSPGLQSRLGMGIDGIDFLQGCRVIVSNLHPIVTKQDVVELFGDIGPLKKVQFVEQGVAEVVFVKQADAQRAIENYHNRELDGQPMICKLAGSSVVRQESPSTLTSSRGGTLHSDHFTGVTSRTRITPDVSAIHSALFNRSTTLPNRQRSSIVYSM